MMRLRDDPIQIDKTIIQSDCVLLRKAINLHCLSIDLDYITT